MAAWPGTLPQSVLMKGHKETVQDNKLRSDVDAGIPKQRRRFTAKASLHSVSLIMDDTQMTTFETFYDDTIQDGADAFTWTHPRTLVAATVRIIGTYLVEPLGLKFRVSFNLEILP